VDARIQAVVDQVPEQGWAPAIATDGGIRDGAWVADATCMLYLSAWPHLVLDLSRLPCHWRPADTVDIII
jgi:hypothetical protein